MNDRDYHAMSHARAALMDGKGDYAPRMTAAEAYEAAACAARDCALFDRVAR